jgi:5-methylcytosine-specific restriction enzyme subunit McrC
MRAPNIDAGLRDELRSTYGNLSGIDIVKVTDALFRRVQLHRNNRYYGFLLFVCRLVHSLKLPVSGETGGNRFSDLLSDEKKMEKVFESFLRNFYRAKQSEFNEVGSIHLQWNVDPTGGGDLTLLPEMRTDVTLRNAARTVVVDAKYYKDALKEYYGSKKAHAENLYQLLAYLRAESASVNPTRPRPDGILIYPVGDSKVDESYVIDGYLVRLFTLDLNQPWREIERDLLRLLEPPAIAE